MSSANPPYPSRNVFTTSTKLPDRTAFGANATQQTFGNSTFGQRPDQHYQPLGGPIQPQHVSAPMNTRGASEKEPNALSELSDEQREELNEAFQLFDLDRDRHIDYHELRVALRALGFFPSKAELAQMLYTHGIPKPGAKKIDLSRVGREGQNYHVSQLRISHAAFIRITAQKVIERDPMVEVERAYVMFDQDRKGFIVLDDLRRLARDLGETGLEEEEIAAMIEEFDYEGNGYVTKDAFYAICLQ